MGERGPRVNLCNLSKIINFNKIIKRSMKIYAESTLFDDFFRLTQEVDIIYQKPCIWNKFSKSLLPSMFICIVNKFNCKFLTAVFFNWSVDHRPFGLHYLWLYKSYSWKEIQSFGTTFATYYPLNYFVIFTQHYRKCYNNFWFIA